MKELDASRWSITYLVADSRLSQRERIELMVVATEMYVRKEKSKEIATDAYEGVLTTAGEYQVLGVFGGQRFSARLETNHGKSRLEFLVVEKINPQNN